MTYIKGFVAVVVAAFVVIVYTLAVVMFKNKQVGVGALVGYFTQPLFWMALVANCAYAYTMTVRR